VGYVGQLAAVAVLAWMGALTVPAVYAAMTITFLLAALVQATRVRMKLPAADQVRGISAEFWVLGRWMLATSLTTFFTGYGVQLCLNWAQDITHVAKFGAMANLTRLANPVLAAMTGLIIPAVAASGQARAGLKYALLGGALLAPYFGLLLIAPQFGVGLIYGRDSEYLGYPPEVRATIAGAAVLFVTAMLTAVLGGLGRSKAFFYTQVVNTIATILLVFPAAVVFGWRGAIFAVLGTTLITLAITLVLLLKNPRPIAHPVAPDVPPSP
jgi:O-antigen/teichoic acid export membrane protein